MPEASEEQETALTETGQTFPFCSLILLKWREENKEGIQCLEDSNKEWKKLVSNESKEKDSNRNWPFEFDGAK